MTTKKRLTISALCLIIISCLGFCIINSAWSQAVTFGSGSKGTEPIAYWDLDEAGGPSAYDRVGADSNGTLDAGSGGTNTETGHMRYLEGRFGAALEFDGTDDVVTVPHNVNLEPASITVAFWVKLEDDSARHCLVSKWTGYTMEVAADNAVRWGLSGPSDQYFEAGTVSWNQWHFLTGTFDDTTKLQCIYVDGVLKGSQTVTGSISYAQNSLYMSGSWDRAKGVIDDVKIYNRALSAAEVKMAYNGGAAVYIGGAAASGGTSSGGGSSLFYDPWGGDAPVGWWSFNESSGTAAYDASGSANDGTIAAAEWAHGRYGPALDFDNEDYVDCGNDTSLDITDAITLEAWIKPSRTSPSPGQNFDIKYDGDVLPQSADPAWSGRYTGDCVVDNGILRIIDNSSSNLCDYYHYPLGMSRSTGATFIMRVKRNSGSSTMFDNGVYIVDGTSWLIFLIANNFIWIQDDSGSFSYSVDTTEFQIYRITLKNGLANIYLNENSVPVITETIEKTTSLNVFQFGSSYQTYSISDYDWDYVYYDLDGAYAPDDYYLPLEIISKNTSAYALQIRNGTLHGFINDQDVTTPIDTGLHHVALVYDGSEQRLYVDGILKDSAALSGAISTNTDSLKIGNYFNGLIDEIKIYDYARNSAQVAWDYNKGKPVGWWKLDKGSDTTAYDSSGNSNNGTLTNMEPATDWVAGKHGNALDFGGTDEFVDCGNDSSLAITGAISLGGWVKLNSLLSDAQFFGRGIGLGGDGDYGYAVSFATATGQVCFDTYSATTRDSLSSSSVTISDNDWHYIIATWDGTTNSNGKKLYIDGVLVNQKTSTISTVGTPNYSFTINGVRYFIGIVDDVRLYNYARTQAQVFQDYNEGASMRLGNN